MMLQSNSVMVLGSLRMCSVGFVSLVALSEKITNDRHVLYENGTVVVCMLGR